jgi:hypothetical protein
VSTFVTRSFVCPRCGQKSERSVALGVNIGRHARPREQILARAFQRFPCPRCAVVSVVEDAFTYVDFDRKQLLALYPRAEQPRWRERDAEVRALFERNFTADGLPGAARELGEGQRVRSVFGLEALREKLVCFDAGLDDAALEAMKVELLRRGLPMPQSVDDQLRLDEVRDDALVLRVEDGGTVTASRRDYATACGDAYAPLRAELAAGPYVDAARLVPL